MAIVTLADAKKQLNIDPSETRDDVELQVFVDAATAAVELQLGQVVGGEELRPGGERPHVGDERPRPQRFGQRLVGRGLREHADQVLAAAQRVLQVVEHRRESGQLLGLVPVQPSHRLGRGAGSRFRHGSRR